MEFVVALFGFGALLLLVGIVGGDLTFQGATIPRVGRIPRFTLTVLGVVFVACSGVVWAMTNLPSTTSREGSSADPGPSVGAGVVEVEHELAPFHRSETLELFLDQKRVGTSTVKQGRRVNVLRLDVAAGEHAFDASLRATTHGGDQSRFTGSGVIETSTGRRFLVRINRSTAGVELVPAP